MDEPNESNKKKGLFIDNLDWTDPRFAPYRLSNLGELNDAQKDAWLNVNDDVDFGPVELIEEELKEVCLIVDCRVDLASTSANVCMGVEKGWPNPLFGEPDFNKLEPKQQRYINRSMGRKAVMLSNIYFHEDRYNRRRTLRTKNAMNWYYELRFRRNQYNRIKALGEPGHSANNNDSTIGSRSASLNDASMNFDTTQESMNSVETVINTGRTQGTQPSQKSSSKTDENDNEHADVDANANANGIGGNNENDANAENVKNVLPKRKPGRLRKNSIIQQASVENNVLESPHVSCIELLISEDEEENDEEENDEETMRYAEIFTESMTASPTTLSPNDGSDSDRHLFVCYTPKISSQEFVSQPEMTLTGLQTQPNSLFNQDDDDMTDDDPAELDFLKDNMLTARTSTQK